MLFNLRSPIHQNEAPRSKSAGYLAKDNKRAGERGQLLAELILGVTILTVIVVFGAQLVVVSLRASDTARKRGAGARLGEEALEAMRAISQGNDATSQGWNRVYRPPDGSGDTSTSKGASNPYYPIISTSSPAVWLLFSGTETITLEGEVYTRKVIIENVCRNTTSGEISGVTPCGGGSAEDPGTQKITVTVSKTNAPDSTLVDYFTRFLNEATPQSDWSAAASCGPVAATSTVTAACTTTAGITTTATPGSFKLQ